MYIVTRQLHQSSLNGLFPSKPAVASRFNALFEQLLDHESGLALDVLMVNSSSSEIASLGQIGLDTLSGSSGSRSLEAD